MKRHEPAVIDAIKADRASGMSLSTLVQRHRLSKTTIWHHIQHVELSDAARELIRSYQGGTKVRCQQDWGKATQQAKQLLERCDEDAHWPVLLAALYWCEGTKKSGFVFTNTDESMIKVFLKIMRSKLAIPDSDFAVLIRTCTPMDPNVCRKHWSTMTGLPLSNIEINHDDKHNKSKTQYGMCRITLRKGAYNLKLMHCLTRELVDKMACA